MGLGTERNIQSGNGRCPAYDIYLTPLAIDRNGCGSQVCSLRHRQSKPVAIVTIKFPPKKKYYDLCVDHSRKLLDRVTRERRKR